MKVCKILDNLNNANIVYLELNFKRKNKNKGINEKTYFIDINENLKFVLSTNKGILKELTMYQLVLKLFVWYDKHKVCFCLANYLNNLRIDNLVLFNKIFNKYFDNKELLNTLNYSNLDIFTKQTLIKKELIKKYA